MHEYEQQEQEKNALKNGLNDSNLLTRTKSIMINFRKRIKKWIEKMEGQGETEEISEVNREKIIKNLKIMAGK